MQYNTQVTDIISPLNNTVMVAASSSINYRPAGTTATSQDSVLTAGTNLSVELVNAGGTEFTTGTGTMKVFIRYRIITL